MRTIRYVVAVFTSLLAMAPNAARAGENFMLWNKRMPITFGGYAPPGDGAPLTNFPALVVFSNTTAGAGFDYADFLSPPWGDLRFAAADKTTPLDFEVESWDTNGLSHVWVRVPELTAETVVYALWGMEGAEAPPCTTNGAVWSEGYVAVYHLAEETGAAADSSPLLQSAAKNGGIVQGPAGAVGRCAGWPDGGNDWFQAPHHSSLDGMGKLTLQIWMYDAQNDTQPRGLISKRVSSTTRSYCLFKYTNRALTLYVGNTTCDFGADSITEANRWYFVTVTYDMDLAADRVKLFFDGSLKRALNTVSGAVPATSTDLHIGILNKDYGNCWKGKLDEARISNVARSAGWIWSEYMNMASNDVFNVYGAPEFQDLPAVSNAGGATNVTADSAWLCGTLVATGASATAVSAYWGTTDEGTNASAWAERVGWTAPRAPGAFTVQATGLTADSTYFYRFAASNAAGVVWAEPASAFITGGVWIENTADAAELGPTPGTFTVHRAEGATNTALTVAYAVGGTATPGADYAPLSGALTIPAGEASAPLTVAPAIDCIIEGPEKVTVTLLPGAYVIGDPGSAELEIADNGLALPGSVYVRKGLAAHWDGIDNAGTGVYDPATTVWADLSGSGRDLTLPPGATVAGNGVTFNNANASFTYPGYQRLANATAELRMSVPPTYAPTAAGLNLGVHSANYSAWEFGFRTTNAPGLLVGTALAAGGSSYMYGTAEGVSLEAAATPATYAKMTEYMGTVMYTDGVKHTLSNIGGQNSSLSDNLTLGSRNGAVGTIHACRLYNRRLTDDERAFNRALDRVRFDGTAKDDAGFPAGWRVGATGDREVLFSLTAADGNGTVAVGGESGATASAWMTGDTTVTLAATPASGYEFVCWRGDAAQLEGVDTALAAVQVPADMPRTLQAVFAPTGGAAFAWTGGGDGADWFDPANWGGAIPCAGSAVTIGSGTVVLDAPTPALGALTIGADGNTAKLIMSNWMTRVRADAVAVGAKGTIAAEGGFTEFAMSNRVWLVGGTLTVAAGGRITADAAGWLTWYGPTRYEDFRVGSNVDPFFLSSKNNLGASYGGRQGYPSPMLQGEPVGTVYGSVEEPTDPGTGGGSNGGGVSVAKGSPLYTGGGAIRLDFTGAVEINGSVTANAKGGSSWMNGGTGGSVWINCQTFSGSGKVTADAQAKDAQGCISGTSSGGRVAVHYDVGEQKGVVSRVRLSANGGLVSADSTQTPSEPGTVWMPDTQLLVSPLLHNGQFVFPATNAWAVDSLEVEGRVWWPANFDLKVAGDLAVVSSNVYCKGMRFNGGRLTVGGDVTVAGATLRLMRGCEATIGGGLQQTNTMKSCESANVKFGRVYLHAAPTNGVDGIPFGQTVRIGGTWSVASNSICVFYADWTNGAVTKVWAKNVTLDAGARFTANRGGWRQLRGPGAGNTSYQVIKSASHGGHGGAFSPASQVATYGDEQHPLHPGSGGGGSEGGGAIVIEAERSFTLNGTVSVDAGAATTWQGAASGGSVYLTANKFTGTTGVVSADGGNGGGTATSSGRPGGGGRIAIWCLQNHLSPDVIAAVQALAGVSSGTVAGEIAAENGTVYWGALTAKGLILYLR